MPKSSSKSFPPNSISPRRRMYREMPQLGRRQAPVSVYHLAKALMISPDVIKLLVEEGFLRVAHRGPNYLKTKIARSTYPTAQWPNIPLRWLPRPGILKLNDLVELCRRHGISVAKDSCMGPVLGVKQAGKLMRLVQQITYPRAIDRYSLMLWLCGIEPVKLREIPAYLPLAEKEIRRVSKLPDPQRTEQAIRLLSRFREARKIVEVLLKWSKELDGVEERMKWIKEKEIRLMKAAGIDE